MKKLISFASLCAVVLISNACSKPQSTHIDVKAENKLPEVNSVHSDATEIPQVNTHQVDNDNNDINSVGADKVNANQPEISETDFIIREYQVFEESYSETRCTKYGAMNKATGEFEPNCHEVQVTQKKLCRVDASDDCVCKKRDNLPINHCSDISFNNESHKVTFKESEKQASLSQFGNGSWRTFSGTVRKLCEIGKDICQCFVVNGELKNYEVDCENNKPQSDKPKIL